MADDADLSAEQTDKLVYFQEITHIESFDECKQILEAFEWNIESAVQNTFNDQAPGNANAATSASDSAHQSPTAGGGSGGAFSSSSLSSSTSSLASSSAATTSSAAAAAAAAAFFEFNQQNNDLFSMSANTPPPPPPPNAFNRFGNINNNFQRQAGQSLPSVSIVPQHTLSYHAPRDQALVPHGFFQWSVFILAFPFRFLYSTLLDIFSFFCKFSADSSCCLLLLVLRSQHISLSFVRQSCSILNAHPDRLRPARQHRRVRDLLQPEIWHQSSAVLRGLVRSGEHLQQKEFSK